MRKWGLSSAPVLSQPSSLLLGQLAGPAPVSPLQFHVVPASLAVCCVSFDTEKFTSRRLSSQSSVCTRRRRRQPGVSPRSSRRRSHRGSPGRSRRGRSGPKLALVEEAAHPCAAQRFPVLSSRRIIMLARGLVSCLSDSLEPNQL